jgi:hypothetical protein
MFLTTQSLVALPQLQLIWVTPFLLEAAAALTALFRISHIDNYVPDDSISCRPYKALSSVCFGIIPAPTMALSEHGFKVLLYS